MRRSRNFLRYTNIRQRQKSERRSSGTQTKCPILPDNLRLHFFPTAGENSAFRDQAGGLEQVCSGGIDAAARQARPPDPLIRYFPSSGSALGGVREAQEAARLDAAQRARPL